MTLKVEVLGFLLCVLGQHSWTGIKCLITLEAIEHLLSFSSSCQRKRLLDSQEKMVGQHEPVHGVEWTFISIHERDIFVLFL